MHKTHIYLWTDHRMDFQKFIESIPCIAFPLTASVHPEEQKLNYPLSKDIHHLIIACNAIVIKVHPFVETKFLNFKLDC